MEVIDAKASSPDGAGMMLGRAFYQRRTRFANQSL